MKVREKVAVAAAALLITMGGMASAAHADIVTIDAGNSYQDVGFIKGTEPVGINRAFEVALAGTYQATLTDFSFPEPFQVIQLIVTSATHEYGRLNAPGSFFFDADPGRYFVSFMGQAGISFDLGLYGIEIASAAVTAVPVPPAALLLVSALGVLALLRRRGERIEAGSLAA